MPKPSDHVSLKLDVNAETDPWPAQPAADKPFRILLLGDFSGRSGRGAPAASKWKPVLIDRDNFEQVLAGMDVELFLGGDPPSSRISLRFRELEDFHPDRIYQQAAVFQTLRETRRKLGEVRDEAEYRPSPAVRPQDDLRAFIDQAVAPHLAPRQDPQHIELIAKVDTAASELMRAILHHRDFQALEAAWRAVFFLIRGLETGAQLKLYLLDISKPELAEDLNASTDVRNSELYQLLVEKAAHTPGAEPWAVAAGNFTFGQTESDIWILGQLATVMRAAGAPFLAEASPLGDPASPETARHWSSLRRSPDAAWLGLAVPRFLLRLPFGKETESLESFAFEEMPGTPEHQDYLWGNPAFACVYLLGRAFNSHGWDLRPGMHQEISGLPLHVYEVEGEKQLKPCAELLMTESDAEWILEQGFMPLVSLKNQDAVRLLRFQSIADPLAPLSGPWR